MPTPVKAEIVIAQVGNPAPGGYVSGGRDNIDVGALIALTNRDNAGATGWRWKITPCAAVLMASYGITGDESATCQLTPPDPDGYGDFAVELTVYGDPIPGVPSNRSTALAIVGVRVPIDSYPDGLPLPSEKETSAGGPATLSAVGGRERRLQESLYALAKLLQASHLDEFTSIRAQVGDGTPSAYVSGGVTIKSVDPRLNATMNVGTKTLSLDLADFVNRVEDENGNYAVGNIKFINTDKTAWHVDEATKEVYVDVATGGGGSALPSPYTATLATVDGKANSLLITAPTVSAIDAPQVYIKGVGAHELTPDDVFGGDVIVEGGDTDSTDAGSPGRAILRGGLGTGTGQGGTVSIEGRDATLSGGHVEISSGDASAPGGYSGSVAINSGSCLGQAGDINVGSGNGGTYGGNLYMRAGAASAGQGGFVICKAGAGSTPGEMQFDGCDGVTNGIGGPSRFRGGAGNGSGAGGLCSVAGGAGGSTGDGGALALAGGASTGGSGKVGGSVDVAGGEATGTAGLGGSATLRGADGVGQGGNASCYAGGGPVAGNFSGRGGNATGSGQGGTAGVTGGAGGSTGNGGAASLVAGAAGTGGSAKAGGNAFVTGGNSLGATGTAGHAIVSGGQGITSGGEGRLEGGAGTTTGGNVNLTPGLGASSVPGKTRVTRGAFQVEESTSVVKQLSQTCAPVTTTSTTPTLVWSYPLGTSENLRITVQAEGDPGTAAAYGAVTYTAAFRRTTGDNSGAAQQCGTTQDVSPNGGVAKNGMAVTIALNGNAIEVKVVAPNSTSTLWSVGVGGQGRTGPV